ncbi:hypothetical protein CAPTEDRAFT_213703 [Capitella teleta]|uniref:Uncharacterized protein n=1 Tax=Capitella teleta TaxID=283909 RepID=R7UEQ6_CAPTE|nr:hypothetical protein CAPTEDRAFT_213703 [Capitella teleta]|eukprot:ELU04439.1 hypothetical protein CAPTEDRAFT_213703 [Capitella teleta]
MTLKYQWNLSIEQQVKAICASCYFHLAYIGAIRNSDKRCGRETHTRLVSSKLDFCNSTCILHQLYLHTTSVIYEGSTQPRTHSDAHAQTSPYHAGFKRTPLASYNEDDQPPFVDSEYEDEETRRWRRMRRYQKKRYEYSSLNHNLHFETTADGRGEEATLTIVEEVAVEDSMTEVIDEVLEEMTEVEYRR